MEASNRTYKSHSVERNYEIYDTLADAKAELVKEAKELKTLEYNLFRTYSWDEFETLSFILKKELINVLEKNGELEII